MARYKKDTCLPLEECVHGGLYEIDSRNLRLGVFNKEARGFIGIREKFGNRFLSIEYHWDADPTFGTAQPKILIETIPEDVIPALSIVDASGITRSNSRLFEYIDNALKRPEIA